MNIAEWILVIMLAVTLFIFLVAGIILLIKLIRLADEAQKIVLTGQGIAAKADDIVDNVKGMTSVGGIVKTFANRVVENQERRYAEEDAARAADAEAAARAQAEAEAQAATAGAEAAAAAARAQATEASEASKQARRASRRAKASARAAKKSAKE